MKESKQFERGLALFNAHEFFEAHEVWEELWLVEPEPGKTFLQGLIQVAAAFHHHGRGNSRGRESLLAAGIAKLDRFPGDHFGIALEELRAEAKKWVEISSVGNDAGPRQLPKIRMIGSSVAGRTARATPKRKRGG